MTPTTNGSEIAIIGMACRFPGATSPESFWRNIAAGVESLASLSDAELIAAGVPAAEVRDSRWVRRSPVLEEIEWFDAGFFGYTPLEAQLMDPQQRLFLECCWEAFEAAGIVPSAVEAPVGVFTGAKTNTYLFQIFSNRKFFESVDRFQIALGNDLASMATRVSYKLDLRGPSYAIHTACSTSLVAVHLACQSLLLDECSMALAGGAAINVPQRGGYRYQKGGILSPDGSCRTFDADAAGSNFGNGVGAVLLKRLEDALRDRDPIVAIIKGSATNNDGARKASYTAPGVDGQTAVLLEAMAVADVEPETIGFVEAHGTATELGDAIEMLALTNAFRARTERRGFCALGSVKTNVGHLETAAGIAGLIKSAQALQHQQLPPSLHNKRPSPLIDHENSPFFVKTELRAWETSGVPRRAGVSSFGLGSTNAHVVLEEAPPVAPRPAREEPQLLLLSARSEWALERAAERLAEFLEERPDVALRDVAFTLQVGRKRFAHRRAVLCRGTRDGAELLRKGDPARVFEHTDESVPPGVTFLFPGLGEHYPGMAKELYERPGAFREALDRCAELAAPELGCDLRAVLFAAAKDEREGQGQPVDLRAMLGRGGQRARGAFDETRLAQPALFAVEYALARQWQSWGVEPKALIGYSLGEYVAACVAGVLSLEHAMRLVVGRARLIQGLPQGGMVAVALPEAEVAELAREAGLSVAAVNGPALTVLAGTEDAISRLESALAARETVSRRLPTTHAFHSDMMLPIVAELDELARSVELRAPSIPYVSNVTGTWIRDEEARDPQYWSRHLVAPVRFADGSRALTAGETNILLEVGPGQGLLSFLRQHPEIEPAKTEIALSSLRNVYTTQPDLEFSLASLGKLWLAGLPVDWAEVHGGAGEEPSRIVLPTYAFERQRYWVEPPAGEEMAAGEGAPTTHVTLEKEPDLDDWFYHPGWQLVAAEPGERSLPTSGTWLMLANGEPWEEGLRESLRNASGSGSRIVTALPGAAFESLGEDRYAVRPGDPGDLARLLTQMGDTVPDRILHLWSLPVAPTTLDAEARREIEDRGFFSLLFLSQALGKKAGSRPVHLDVCVSEIHPVRGDERLCPEKATIIGPALVIPQEFPRLTCRVVDLDPRALASSTEVLVQELSRTPEASLVALRAGGRWVPGFERKALAPAAEAATPLRQGGVYLLTGGLGGLGLEVAEHLARTCGARLVLTARTPLPPQERWKQEIETRGAQDPVSLRIRRVERLLDLGSEVEVAAVDVTDPAAMGELIRQTKARFGGLHGVIHLAGIAGGGMIQLKSRAAAETILGPKVAGAQVLLDLLADEPLDFLLLFSSIASVLGEFGQADYCGANAYLDTLAASRRAEAGFPVLAVNWDIWQEVGLAVATEVPEHLRAWRQEMLDKAMTSTEGLAVLDRVLAARLPRVVVSTQDLQGRIALGKSFTGERFLAELDKVRGGSAQQARGERSSFGSTSAMAGDGLERRIVEIWKRVLGAASIGVDDNFFDLGGNSLLGLQLVSEISREVGVDVAPVTLFEAPTVRALTRHLQPAGASELVLAGRARSEEATTGKVEIAIVAMAGRFPGAASPEQLWANLERGVESITFLADDELLAAGVPPELVQDPRYVKAAALVDGIELFDAGLFGYSPREAEVMDPQHRVFLEVAWETLERAGYDSTRYPGSIGVFAGSNLSTYLLQMHADPRVRSSVNMLQAILGNDKDSLTTTVSYKLDLRGPSIAVQTFCSTSLVAVHMAVQSLRHRECDMALAGGIRLVTPGRQGYLYEEGGIAPPDGHSRSFDAGANGSVLGNGVGIVLLKRLDDALRDGDQVLAVIKGSAINNDGSLKAGYTAPSVQGQMQAIAAAYEDAGVDPGSITYLEAHGSATELGDPIEIAALTKAFRHWTRESGYCHIGSVKSNFGHLDRAAGVTGLIKTVLALEHELIPSTILFETPNPKIDFAASPFVVAAQPVSWPASEVPRRAGVNSLGMGGTNVHVVLEEAPALPSSTDSRPWQLLVLSAHTENALEVMTDRLAAFLAERPDTGLADAAFTLQVGRRGLRHRRSVVARSTADAAAALDRQDPRRRAPVFREEGERRVVFLFPGLGGQYQGMARGLYETEPDFRADVDQCLEILRRRCDLELADLLLAPPAEGATVSGQPGVDLRAMLRRGQPKPEAALTESPLDRTLYAQPATFVIEYALARLWMRWGVRPAAMVGYSLGEYVAACLADVLDLEAALILVVERARLIDASPRGAMLAVSLAAAEVEPLLGDELAIAGINGPRQTVVAGPLAAVSAFEAKLAELGAVGRQLQTTHAFHSKMMLPLFQPMVELGSGFELGEPRMPYFSNVTGTWLTADQAKDPGYWAQHLCGPVRFGDAVRELLTEPGAIFLEVGPGQTLTTLLLQQATSETARVDAFASLRHAYETQADEAFLLSTLGRLWSCGVEPDWQAFWARETRRRILLPTYAFERKRYWINTSLSAPADLANAADGLAALVWRPVETPRPPQLVPADLRRWLVVAEPGPIVEAVLLELEARGAEVYHLDPGAESSFPPDEGGPSPRALLWLAGAVDGGRLVAETMLAFVRGQQWPRLRFVFGAENLFQVAGSEDVEPLRVDELAAFKLIGAERPDWTCRVVEIEARDLPRVARALVAEVCSESMVAETMGGAIAYRGRQRWRSGLEAVTRRSAAPAVGHGQGVLLFDGLGERCFPISSHLGTRHGARLVSLEPDGFPVKADWDDWLQSDPSLGRLSQRILRARELERAGVDLEVVSVDRTDPAALGAAMLSARARLGSIEGLVYSSEANPPGSQVQPDARERNWRALSGLEALLVDGLLPSDELVWALTLVSPLQPEQEDLAAAVAEQLPASFCGRLRLVSDAPWRSVWWDPPTDPEALANLVEGVLACTQPQILVSQTNPAIAWTPHAGFLGRAVEAPPAEAVGLYERPELRVDFLAPRNELEETIAKAWRDLLGVGRVGIHDNFLELGGDSLLASRLVTRLREALHVDLPIRILFEASTVAELAMRVEALREEARSAELEAMLTQVTSLSDEDLEREIERFEAALDREA